MESCPAQSPDDIICTCIGVLAIITEKEIKAQRDVTWPSLQWPRQKSQDPNSSIQFPIYSSTHNAQLLSPSRISGFELLLGAEN